LRSSLAFKTVLLYDVSNTWQPQASASDQQHCNGGRKRDLMVAATKTAPFGIGAQWKIAENKEEFNRLVRRF
jgi:hypothetical protein